VLVVEGPLASMLSWTPFFEYGNFCCSAVGGCCVFGIRIMKGPAADFVTTELLSLEDIFRLYLDVSG